MDAGLPGVEFEAHGQVAPAVEKNEEKTSKRPENRQIPAFFMPKSKRLYMRFGRLCQEGIEDGFQQTFATDPDVVYELEEAQVERELLLRDTSVGTQPGA